MNQKKQDFTVNLHDAKPLPYSEETEKAVLAQILEDVPEFMPQAMKYLNVKDMFYNSLNDELWNLIKSQSKDGYVTAKQLQGHYEGTRDGEKINHFLMVCRGMVTPSQFVQNCLLLCEFWTKRTIHRLGHYLNAHSLKSDGDILELLGVGSDSLDKIYRHISQMNEVTLGDGVTQLARELVAISNSPDGMLGIKGSIPELNNVIKGYRDNLLISIGATTGEGKTTLALQEIRHFIEQGIPTGVISLEMTIAEYLLIMGCDKLGVSIEHVLDSNAEISPEQKSENMQRLAQYMEDVKKMPLYISDKPAQKIGEIKAKARMWRKNKGIRALFVDHGHLVEGDVPYGSAEQKFTDIANQLKALAKELGIPIIVLWQLARRELSEARIHRIADIKYAGGVEQASDIVLLIYRPELHGIENDSEGNSTKGFARIMVGKLRLLPKKDIKCHFTGTRFVSLSDWNMRKLTENQPAPLNPHAGIKPNYQQNKFNPNDWNNK